MATQVSAVRIYINIAIIAILSVFWSLSIALLSFLIAQIAFSVMLELAVGGFFPYILNPHALQVPLYEGIIAYLRIASALSVLTLALTSGLILAVVLYKRNRYNASIAYGSFTLLIGLSFTIPTYYQVTRADLPAGADPTTYRVLNVVSNVPTGYSEDKMHVYWEGNIIVGADPHTFITLGATGYGKDAAHVFYAGTPVQGANAATFRVVPYTETYCGLTACPVDASDGATMYWRGHRG